MRLLSDIKLNTKDREFKVAVFIGCFAPLHKGHIDAILSADQLFTERNMDVQLILIIPHNDIKVKQKTSDKRFSFNNRMNKILAAEIATNSEVVVDDVLGLANYGSKDNARELIVERIVEEMGISRNNVIMIVGSDKLGRTRNYIEDHTVVCVRRPGHDKCIDTATALKKFQAHKDHLIIINRSNSIKDITSKEIRNG